MDNSGLFEIDIDGEDVVSKIYHVPKSNYVHELDHITSRLIPVAPSEAYLPNQYENRLGFPQGFLNEYKRLEVAADISSTSETKLKEYQTFEVLPECLNLPEMSEDPCTPLLITPEVTITAQESIKKRNTPYLLKEDSITTKPMTPVTFLVSGAKQEQYIQVSMRYSENPNQNKPVNVCKLHQDCEICKDNQRDHPENFNFCINQLEKFHGQYQLMDGHPTAILTLTEDVISEDGKAIFNIIFPCLNSCKTHSRSGKKLHLIMKIFDRLGQQLCDPIQYTVRVCKNVKRDHAENEEHPRDQEKLDVPQDFLKDNEILKSDPVILPDISSLETLDESVIFFFPEDKQTIETETSCQVAIQVQESFKKKNTPYLLKENSITTKPMTPVAFVVSGAKQARYIQVSMRYSENPNQNKPVNVCKLHQDCEICKDNQSEHPKNFNFCINHPEKFSCQYSHVDGHPTAILTLVEDVISEDGKAKFDIIFPCLNSCNVHRHYGKKLHLILEIFDREENQLGNPIQFQVRVCKNVKRDHVDGDEYHKGNKRIRKSIKEEEMNKNIQTADVAQNEAGPTTNASGTQGQEAPTWTCFMMKSLDHQEQVVSMIKHLQGEVFSFDDPAMALE
nr:uncharacterized protein LOC113824784 [Penaeus vannamei]